MSERRPTTGEGYPQQQWNGPPPAMPSQHQINQQPYQQMQQGFPRAAYPMSDGPQQQQPIYVMPVPVGRRGFQMAVARSAGYKVAGLYVAAQCIGYLGVFGIFLILTGSIVTGLGFGRADDYEDFSENFEDQRENPFEVMQVAGPVVISVGVALLIAASVLGFLAYKQSRKLAKNQRAQDRPAAAQASRNQVTQMLAPSSPQLHMQQFSGDFTSPGYYVDPNQQHHPPTDFSLSEQPSAPSRDENGTNEQKGPDHYDNPPTYSDSAGAGTQW